MAISYAMLLDGGFLRRKLGTPKQPVDAAAISTFTTQAAASPCLSGMRLHRIYFYDSRPLETSEEKPWGGGAVDFGKSEAAARNKSLQAALTKEPYFALRFGELHLEGWRLKRKVLQKSGPTVEIDAGALEPNIRQKGVDMRIGLDIASLTLKKHVQVIVLVTADSDFVPAMKFARREGAQLVLITLGHGIRDGMREHADVVIDNYPLTTASAAQERR
jgi:uncharacterized LabA/DUF88 family protein